MKYFSSAGAVLLSAFAATAGGIEFDPQDEASILSVTRQYAYSLMSMYQGNATNLPKEDIGIWPQPHYWWEGGAAWGGMIEYSQFSGDDSHVKALQQALTANYGPDNDFILSYRRSQTGNDDQAFWALAVMSALEYQFPDPAQAPANYLEVATNAFENIVGRWDETTCDGGLKWQIYPENSYGYNYKNSISNGCAFALGARLARYTGEQKYADWAVKIYDWTKKVGLISDKFEVFDGTDDKTDCAKVADETQWTYNNAMFLHGSAFMYDYTNGDETWKDRTSGFLDHAELLFFRPFENATDIMYEWACETGESGRHCNLDQQSFKAYLSRFIAKTAMLAPFTKDRIVEYLTASAVGAAKSCSGGEDGKTCGSKWYTGGWDGTSGVGQQLSALEVTQALLMIKKDMLPAKNGAQKPSTSAAPKPSSKPAPSAAKSSAAAPLSTLLSSSQVVAPTQAAPTQAAPTQAAPTHSAPTQAAPTEAAPTSSEIRQSPSPSKIPSSEAPASKAPAPASSKVPEAIHAPTSSLVIPSLVVVTSTSPSSTPASSGKPGGQFDETPSSASCASDVTKTVTISPVSSTSTTSCTPSVTTTVYVPGIETDSAPSPSAPAPAVPAVPTTLTQVSPSASSSVPNPTSPTEFLGAGSSLTASNSALAIFVAAAVFALA
ncbi:glycoside hydrolase family 76 protein [Stemphylium lycopersici]|nr:glycoside hydrolase family 76 protein [Stemphylium lycopersici]